MKKILVIVGILILGGAVAAVAMSGKNNNTWRYKMIVEVETPEGLKTGSAVRAMGNGAASLLLYTAILTKKFQCF